MSRSNLSRGIESVFVDIKKSGKRYISLRKKAATYTVEKVPRHDADRNKNGRGRKRERAVKVYTLAIQPRAAIHCANRTVHFNGRKSRGREGTGGSQTEAAAAAAGASGDGRGSPVV